jgi:hypothetical protein
MTGAFTDDWTQEDREDYFAPNGTESQENLSEAGNSDYPEGERSASNYDALLTDDYTQIIKGTRSKVAKEYESKVKSLLKTGALGALRTGNLPDAAAIFRFGPEFSAAAGDLAVVSDSAAKAIDLLTAPDNPYVVFALTALSFGGQIFRNHEPAVTQVTMARRQMKKYRKEHPEEFAQKKKEQKKNVTVSLPFGRKLQFRVGFKVNPFASLRFIVRGRTSEPSDLVTTVFSDGKLIAALKKQGIDIVQTKM